MSYGYGSSGSSDWYGGGGTGDSDCMSQDTYWRLVESGASISGVYVCGLGYIAGSAEVWGSSGSSAEDWWSGSNDWGYGSDSEYYGSSEYCPLCGGELVSVSGSGSKRCSRCGADSEGSYASGGCPEDECKNNSDCGPYKVCVKRDCGFFSSYRRCRNMDAMERECADKSWGDRCNFVKGNYRRTGRCSSTVWAPALYCYDSDIPHS